MAPAVFFAKYTDKEIASFLRKFMENQRDMKETQPDDAYFHALADYKKDIGGDELSFYMAMAVVAANRFRIDNNELCYFESRADIKRERNVDNGN